VKLQEIREKYLSLQIPTPSAVNLLVVQGMDHPVANELLSLWVGDEWERSVKHVPECIRARAGIE